MAKQFYTERDIEDLAARGVLSLEVNDDVVLTELAYERAERLGVRLLRGEGARGEQRPAAPVRPYLSEPEKKKPAQVSPAPAAAGGAPRGDELRQRIRAAAVARLGPQVDTGLLDAIIARVLANIGAR